MRPEVTRAAGFCRELVSGEGPGVLLPYERRAISVVLAELERLDADAPKPTLREAIHWMVEKHEDGSYRP